MITPAEYYYKKIQCRYEFASMLFIKDFNSVESKQDAGYVQDWLSYKTTFRIEEKDFFSQSQLWREEIIKILWLARIKKFLACEKIIFNDKESIYLNNWQGLKEVTGYGIEKITHIDYANEIYDYRHKNFFISITDSKLFNLNRFLFYCAYLCPVELIKKFHEKYAIPYHAQIIVMERLIQNECYERAVDYLFNVLNVKDNIRKREIYQEILLSAFLDNTSEKLIEFTLSLLKNDEDIMGILQSHDFLNGGELELLYMEKVMPELVNLEKQKINGIIEHNAIKQGKRL